jgi:hypothetical protein
MEDAGSGHLFIFIYRESSPWHQHRHEIALNRVTSPVNMRYRIPYAPAY